MKTTPLLLITGSLIGLLFLISTTRPTAIPTQALPVVPAEPAATAHDTLDHLVPELMKQYSIPGVSIGVLQNGQLTTTKTYGLIRSGQDAPINPNTMFSVGSVSKVVAATLTLKLVAEGMLDLDADVNTYLKSWKIPDNEFTKAQAVTLRHILSHTAGLTVHGFADYLPAEELPTTVQILKGEKPAKSPAVFVDLPVGSQFRYSGGGITVEQLVVEDVTGMPYHMAADKYLFQPLGLTRTSFENPLPEATGNIANAHQYNGIPVATPRGYQSMPEAAASGLWTTPSDLSTILSMLAAAYHGKSNDFLPQELVQDMVSPEKASEFGLGPKIEQTDGHPNFFHNGANDSYRARFKVFLEGNTGYVIFTNGRRGSDLIGKVGPVLDAMCD